MEFNIDIMLPDRFKKAERINKAHKFIYEVNGEYYCIGQAIFCKCVNEYQIYTYQKFEEALKTEDENKIYKRFNNVHSSVATMENNDLQGDLLKEFLDMPDGEGARNREQLEEQRLRFITLFSYFNDKRGLRW